MRDLAASMMVRRRQCSKSTFVQACCINELRFRIKVGEQWYPIDNPLACHHVQLHFSEKLDACHPEVVRELPESRVGNPMWRLCAESFLGLALAPGVGEDSVLGGPGINLSD